MTGREQTPCDPHANRGRDWCHAHAQPYSVCPRKPAWTGREQPRPYRIKVQGERWMWECLRCGWTGWDLYTMDGAIREAERHQERDHA